MERTFDAEKTLACGNGVHGGHPECFYNRVLPLYYTARIVSLLSSHRRYTHDDAPLLGLSPNHLLISSNSRCHFSHFFTMRPTST